DQRKPGASTRLVMNSVTLVRKVRQTGTDFASGAVSETWPGRAAPSGEAVRCHRANTQQPRARFSPSETIRMDRAFTALVETLTRASPVCHGQTRKLNLRFTICALRAMGKS